MSARDELRRLLLVAQILRGGLLTLRELRRLLLIAHVRVGLLLIARVLPGGRLAGDELRRLLLWRRDVLRGLLLPPAPRLGGLLRVPRIARGGGGVLLRPRISVGAGVGSPGVASHGPLVLRLRPAHCQSVSDAF